jgi:multidrug efflux pump
MSHVGCGACFSLAMNISAPFVHRPVATTLLTVAIALAGRWPSAFCRSPAAAGGLPDHLGERRPAGRQPGDHGVVGGHPARAPVRTHRRRHRDDLVEHAGAASITLQFDLNRNIDAAARDVQAAIAAARGYLPTNLPSNPNYRKVNPADSPIFMIALTSDTLTKGQMYDAASTIMAQKLSQVQGVGQVGVGGSALPGVRVELNPSALNKYGIGLEQVRTALAAANANTPKGHFSDGQQMFEVGANDQLFKAIDYKPLLIAYHNGASVRVSDVGDVVDSVEDLRNAGYANGKPSVLVIIFRQPGANIIDTVDRIRAVMPQLHAAIPAPSTCGWRWIRRRPSALPCTTWSAPSSSRWRWWCWWSSYS